MADSHQLTYIINHVFLPPKLPQHSDESAENYAGLCRTILHCAEEYSRKVTGNERARWGGSIVRMLERLCFLETPGGFIKENVEACLLKMKQDDVLALLIRRQNAGLVIRRFDKETVFESFEVSASNEDVMATKGKLLCSYPGPAIAVPTSTSRDPRFVSELANFLTQFNEDLMDDTIPTATKAGTELGEIRDTVHPRYITELLTGILRGVGRPVEVVRISKRIADDVLWKGALLPWRRSPIWLLIRVALQTTLLDGTDHLRYKSFIAFSMAQILRTAAAAGLDSDLLCCMNKKVSRRLHKLGSAAPQFLTAEILDVSALTDSLLQQRWDAEQKRHAEASLTGWDPTSLDILSDTRLSLTNSKAYILKALQGSRRPSSVATFHPEEKPRFLKLSSYASGGVLTKSMQNIGSLALMDFECAIENDIDVWVLGNLKKESACGVLQGWIKEYYKIASKEYHDDPEAMSIMFLTLVELWVGLDKLAIHQCPLLSAYSPEVRDTYLEPILLRRSASRDRLERVIQHLRTRHSCATHRESIFSGKITQDSFVIRYFNCSPLHQALKQRIEAKANSDRSAKVQELHRLNQRHAELTRKAQQLSHSTDDKGDLLCKKGKKKKKGAKCSKCRLKKEAAGLSIHVFEWPLPSAQLEAQATVVEMECPVAFNVWREATYYLLWDIWIPSALRTKASSGPKAEKLLRDYQGLKAFAKPLSNMRLTFGSKTKSFLDSHYKKPPSIPTSEDRVCLRNALQFSLRDTQQNLWVSNPFTSCTIWKSCTYQLPTGPYRKLQFAIDGTDHTSNEILANQVDCPSDISLHEHIAFGSLRSGSRLQWLNILRELTSRQLTFQRTEVEMLILQSVLQVGPLGSDSRWHWHVEISDSQFCMALLGQLEDLQNAIKLNWMEAVSLRIVIVLTMMVLSSCWDETVAQAAIELLQKARDIAYGWMEQVGNRLRDSMADKNIARELQTRLCEIAAMFRSSYDLDPKYQRVLFSSGHHLSRFVTSGITLHDNFPAKGAPKPLSQLLDRDRRLARSLQPLLKVAVVTNGQGFTRAIQEIWPPYDGASEWRVIPAPNDRWISNVTDGKNRSSFVHYNLLDNTLLINGKPPSRLPSDYTNHATYSRIFGQAILDVVATNNETTNMDFMASNLIFGNHVFFMMNAGELVVQIKFNDRTYEYIPHRKLTGDLPTFLVDDYTHWLDLSDGVIELRPLDNIWLSNSDNWRVAVHGWQMWKPSSLGKIQLVDIRSRSAMMLASRLSSLDGANYLTTTFCEATGLSVDVSRIRLSFQLDCDGALSCHSLPGMIVDDNQSAGVFIGLRDQLVLCDRRDELKREVLIPIGDVRYTRSDGHHTITTIQRDCSRHIHYYRYRIDSLLGRLVSNVGIHGKLYQVYLHAVTSHCMPDPLTGRTGTEEALHELQSASCSSFQTLDKDCQTILRNIFSLTPQRIYYPSHLKVMQTVHWNELYPTAQHDRFAGQCRAISALAHQLHVFTPKDKALPISDLPAEDVNLSLLSRAAARNLCYFPPEFQLLEHVTDTTHRSRDLICTSQEALVYQDASLVVSQPSRLATTQDLLEVFKKWSVLSGPQANISKQLLSYHRRWTDEKLSNHWLTLYQILRTRQSNQYQMLFTFCAIGYGSRSTEFRRLLPTLLAFATNEHLHGADMAPPIYNSYDLSEDFVPRRQQLVAAARNTAVSFEKSFAAHLPRREAESDHDLTSRRYSSYCQRLDFEAQNLAELAIQQWPCKIMSISRKGYTVMNVGKFLEDTRPLFAQWYRNHELFLFTSKVQRSLDINSRSGQDLKLPDTYHFQPCLTSMATRYDSVSIDRLLLREAPSIKTDQDLIAFHVRPQTAKPSDMSSTLSFLLEELRAGAQDTQSQYAVDLERSLHAFQSDNLSAPSLKGARVDMLLLTTYYNNCSRHSNDVWAEVRASLTPTTASEIAILQSGLWPRLSIPSLLERLASANGGSSLTQQWIDALRILARSILLLQRARRLCILWSYERMEDFWKEMEAPTSMIELVDNSDWLLIQVDGDFLMRPGQLTVANEMISPPGMQNTVLQLNMGEGKSSVIIPLVAASIADRNRLARVIVLKPLAAQMYSLLVERLSGLTNRRVMQLPFSRDVEISQTQVQTIYDTYKQAMASQAVLVMQPEHVLSLMLMAADHLVNARTIPQHRLSRQLLDLQLWLDRNSRDILDESDEILHVRYQLVYTMGTQQSLEHSPNRWTTAQQILSLARKCILLVQNKFPFGVEVSSSSRKGSFPHIRVLDPGAGLYLIECISKEVVNGALENCSFSVFPLELRRIAQDFISCAHVSESSIRLLEDHCKGTSLWKDLLLLRGLLGHGVLLYALKERRWRVDYGLDISRSLLAVPFRAKDVPSLKAEFGHPDVANLLTCLSYQYGGLNDGQVELCFDMLYKLDNPKLEYEKWVAAMDDVPSGIRNLSGINMQDLEQRQHLIFPLFSANYSVIDFYLSQVVFPKAAKEFSSKLGTSGWDLAQRKANATTGFSGTNDNRYLLPTSIIQQDTPLRLSTNARVLAILLQPSNNLYMCPNRVGGQSLSGHDIINAISANYSTLQIHVLLDVGAQILEMTNLEVAQYWLLRLSERDDVKAAIFFNDRDQLEVLTRDGLTELLMLSPYHQQINKCLVYLDDAHTRGTDLKLPIDWRACVTLGPKVTKDRLVQGCMRMRKLGQGQSVMFMAPYEVDRAIRERSQKDDTEPVTSLDVLRWAINETCREVEHYVPHWVQQGVDYHTRSAAWERLSSTSDPSTALRPWVQPEAQTLQKMYLDSPSSDANILYQKARSIPEIRERCRLLGVKSILNPRVAEEQEREVNHEIEREPQKQRPPKAQAMKHHVHDHVRIFVESGCIPPNSSIFISIFLSLRDGTSNVRGLIESMAPGHRLDLFATYDFLTTVQSSSRSDGGDYIRPVNWLVTGKDGILVALSPYEVNELLPRIRISKNVNLHIYTPRATQDMDPIDHLKLYCIPSLPSTWKAPSQTTIDLLNLAAGQLYFSDYEGYLRVCALLGICTPEDQKQADMKIQADGFILPEDRVGRVRDTCIFDKSPLPYLKVLTGFRRKGQTYGATHLGKILRTRFLHRDMFD